MKRGRWLLALVGSLAVPAMTTVAHADDREQCVQAADQAQDLRDKGQYRRARESMLVCSRDVCPGAVKRDCAQWLTDLDNTAPTVVVSAKAGGADTLSVKVTVDGVVLADKLDGKPILVDPGEHTFRYETANAPPKEEKLVIIAGQKNRLLTVTFGDAPTPPPPPPPPGGDKQGPPILAYALVGVGVVGLGVGTFFWLSGLGDKNHLEDTCGPKNGLPGTCTQDQVDSARQKLLIGDISGGLGIAAIVGGVVVYVLRPKAEAKVQTGTVQWNFDARPLPGGGAGFVGGTF